MSAFLLFYYAIKSIFIHIFVKVCYLLCYLLILG